VNGQRSWTRPDMPIRAHGDSPTRNQPCRGTDRLPSGQFCRVCGRDRLVSRRARGSTPASSLEDGIAEKGV